MCWRTNPDISHFFRLLSLTPGFSPVKKGEDGHSRFNGFPQRAKAAENVVASAILADVEPARPARRQNGAFPPSERFFPDGPSSVARLRRVDKMPSSTAGWTPAATYSDSL